MTMQQQNQIYLKNPYVFNSFPNGQNNRHMGQLFLSKQNDNFVQNGQNQHHIKPIYQNFSLKQSINQLPNESKISNEKNRKQLPPQVNQSQQIKKQQQRQYYRKQLQAQIKADKQRKQKQKQKIEKQQLERQRKFYAEINKSKTKQKKNKQQQSYFILRSSRGKRKDKQNNLTERDQSRLNYNEPILEKSEQLRIEKVAEYPKIIKRGGYNNHSILDNYHNQKSNQQQHHSHAQKTQSRFYNNHSAINPSPFKSLQLTERYGQGDVYMVQVINPEEERIRSIIKMQEKMLKKLDNVKQQINKINNNRNLQKEVQHIRNILRSKPIKQLDPWSIRNNDSGFQYNNDFYRFPKLQSKTLTKNSHQNQRSRLHSSMNINQHNNEKLQRIFTEQFPQNNYQQQQNNPANNQKNTKRKRVTKTLNRVNDKNYSNTTEQNEQNEQNDDDNEIRIPIVLQQSN